MDALKWKKITNDYLNYLNNDPDYLKLIELANVINNRYYYLINDFNIKKEYLAKANYKYREYDKLKEDYRLAKIKLYSKEEVQKYLEIRRKVENKINIDLKEIYEKVILNI